MSRIAVPAAGAVAQPPRLLDELRDKTLACFGRPQPAVRHVEWVRRFILFHGKQHPRELGVSDVGRFREHLAQSEREPLRCLEQAREALEFLYQRCLDMQRGELPFPEPPRLLNRLRRALRLRHDAPRTASCSVEWAVRFLRCHGLRPPNPMGGAEIEMFLTDLAFHGLVSASTQNQAFNALLFLFRQVLGMELPRLDTVRASGRGTRENAMARRGRGGAVSFPFFTWRQSPGRVANSGGGRAGMDCSRKSCAGDDPLPGPGAVGRLANRRGDGQFASVVSMGRAVFMSGSARGTYRFFGWCGAGFPCKVLLGAT